MVGFDISDRWLWLSAGVFFLLAARGVRHAITDTVRLIELPPDEGRSQKDEREQPEDKISLKSLRMLAVSPNPSIRSAAASLIITRFASLPSAAEMITSDLDSRNPETSRKARQAVKYLQDWDQELTSGLPISPYRRGDSPTNVDFPSWQHELDEYMNNPLPRGPDAMLSPLSQLETLTNIGVLNRGDSEHQQQTAARIAGRARVPTELGQEEVERRRGRREVALVHEGPGSIHEGDLFRPRRP